MKHAMRWASIAALLIFVPGISSPGFAAALPSSQQSKQSVAEAARKAQEKKKDESKAKTIWTNDNIPNTPGGVSVVGEQPAATNAGESVTGAATEAAPAAVDSAKSDADRAQTLSELDDAQKQLDSLKTDLDILQR
ncbi:MAG TPA: hypothetical protein VJN90_02345, partial [Candidatus Acidoferrales bacterium]|nr:hypothetical protein [Candidatus Acidoferrales bacterium]